MSQSVTINLSGEKTPSPAKTKPRVAEQEEELIDQHMFVEALAVIALEIPYLNPQPSEIEKVKFFSQYVLSHKRCSICLRNSIILKDLLLLENKSD